MWVSRPGNGICHAVHAARFGVPGKICMGGDSHTPHGGAIGMLCIGVGGMDVATAMTGVPMRLKMPKVVNVRLTGSLRPGVNAKEVILELLRRVSIKGGLGKVYMSIPAPAWKRWRCRSAPPSPTWVPRWARPAPFFRQTHR